MAESLTFLQNSAILRGAENAKKRGLQHYASGLI